MKCANRHICSVDINPKALDQDYCSQQCRVDVTGAMMCTNPKCKKIYVAWDEEDANGFFSYEFCSTKCMEEVN